MSDEIPLSKVGKTGFFVVMAPGFYLLVSITVSLIAGLKLVSPQEAWRALTEKSEEMPWSFSIGIILLSYLLGTFIRAISVEVLDRITSEIFRWLPSGWISGFRGNLRADCFPYQRLQKWFARMLNFEWFCPVEEEAAHGRYNLWKMELCQLAPAAFAYTQELEGRVRLMTGMSLAGTGGAVASIVAMLALKIRNQPLDWIGPLVFLLIVSLIFGIFFGSRIRKVRGDEVSFVFLSHDVLRRRVASKQIEELSGGMSERHE